MNAQITGREKTAPVTCKRSARERTPNALAKFNAAALRVQLLADSERGRSILGCRYGGSLKSLKHCLRYSVVAADVKLNRMLVFTGLGVVRRACNVDAILAAA